jgi:hypothetical protein
MLGSILSNMLLVRTLSHCSLEMHATEHLETIAARIMYSNCSCGIMIDDGGGGIGAHIYTSRC